MGTKRLKLLTFAAAATAICVTLICAGQASAANVACGETITADTTLDGDLVGCPNNGIVIGADGVTLDLGGHVIDGDGKAATGCDPEADVCDFGVINDGHDGLIVKNGSVRQFATGVLLSRARRNRVLEVTSTRNDLFGAALVLSKRSVVRNSSLSRNIAPDGDGMGLFSSDRIRIVGNTIAGNPGPGIHVFDSSRNLIKRNELTRNGPAILMEGSRNEVRNNRIAGGAGIIVGPPGDRNVIAGNRVTGAIDSIAIEKGRGNSVIRNRVVDSRGG